MTIQYFKKQRLMSIIQVSNRQYFFFSTPAENRFFSNEAAVGRKERILREG